MELIYTKEQFELSCEIRAWLETHVPASQLASFDTKDGFEQHRHWEATLSRGRWSAVTWPKEYGGRDLDLIEWLIFEEEYYRANAPGRVNQNGIFLLGSTLIEFGSSEQKTRFLPPMARGEEIWAQAWSEPQAGSNLAALQATARRDGDTYVLRGHKFWSSRAVLADWAFGLFRSEMGSTRHRGLSFILFPLKAAGVRISPITQIDGEAGFAEIFLEDLRVPHNQRLSERVHTGWLGPDQTFVARDPVHAH